MYWMYLTLILSLSWPVRFLFPVEGLLYNYIRCRKSATAADWNEFRLCRFPRTAKAGYNFREVGTYRTTKVLGHVPYFCGRKILLSVSGRLLTSLWPGQLWWWWCRGGCVKQSVGVRYCLFVYMCVCVCVCFLISSWVTVALETAPCFLDTVVVVVVVVNDVVYLAIWWNPHSTFCWGVQQT